MNCDLCSKPVLPGQPRRGGLGDGGKNGHQMGFERHWDCHVEKFGRPSTASISETLRGIGGALKPACSPAPQPKKPLVGPKGSNYNRSANAGREARLLSRVDTVGRTYLRLECPFCLTRFTAFLWSLSGGGKKCPCCGSMHVSGGSVWPLVGNEDL